MAGIGVLPLELPELPLPGQHPQRVAGGARAAPLYDNTVALGLTSGGSGNCRTGGTTFYQPVTEALSRYGVAVF